MLFVDWGRLCLTSFQTMLLNNATNNQAFTFDKLRTLKVKIQSRTKKFGLNTVLWSKSIIFRDVSQYKHTNTPFIPQKYITTWRLQKTYITMIMFKMNDNSYVFMYLCVNIPFCLRKRSIKRIAKFDSLFLTAKLI